MTLPEVRIPVAAGQKAPPLISWETYQRHAPSSAELADWARRWGDANWALVTGAVSGRVVVDVDRERGGDVSLNGRVLPVTYTVRTPSGGAHYYYRHPGGSVPCAVDLLPGIDLRGDGGYVLLPGSRVNGQTYEVVVNEPVAPLPEWLRGLIRRRGTVRGAPMPESEIARLLAGVAEGTRNVTATRLAGHYLGKGLPAGETLEILRGWNARNRAPLADEELRRVVHSITQREARKRAARADLADVEEVVGRWLLLPDSRIVRLVLAAVVANQLGSDPLWLLLIAPPGGAKTVLINAAAAAPGTYLLSDLTPQTLISGKSGDEDASLLPKLANKTLLMKDFTTVLTMHRDSRQQILAQLREIYDGSFAKAFGTGKVVRWQGHVGFLAGVTPVIDTQYSVYQVLGERFLQYRAPAPPAVEAAEFAMRQRGREKHMRAELGQAVAAFFEGRKAPRAEDIPLPDAVAHEIARLSSFVVRARSGVIRDAYGHREIEYVPEPEAPTRLSKQLAVLATALAVVDGTNSVGEVHLPLVSRVGMDCIPQHRALVLNALWQAEGPAATSDVAEASAYPTTTTRRILEDLAALRVVTVEKQGPGRADLWHLADETREVLDGVMARLSTTLPDASGVHNNSSLPPLDDISGKGVGVQP